MKPFSFKLVAVGMVIFAGVTGVRGQALPIRTLAGGVTPGTTNGFGSNARFNHPTGIAADGAGNIYIADTESCTIRKIMPNGYVSTLAGLAGNYGSADGGGASSRFYGPQGIAADNAGQLFVADTANSTIRKVTEAGVVSTYAGAPGDFNSFDGTGANARFYHPEGVALDAGGNLYVTDTWNHTIRKITPAGIVTTLAGLARNFGAADGTNSKARFYRPTGIAVDSSSNIYVADSFNHTIRKITPVGKVSTIAGLAGIWGSADGTNGAARFYLPQGIGIAASGDLYVTDSGNQTLRKVSPIGTNWVASTVAGLSGLAGVTNGTGNNAQFYFPASIALDAAGYVYVTDMGNNLARTTRVVSPTLQFRTSGDQLVLSWPVSDEGFTLEQSDGSGPTAAWSSATNGVSSDESDFFRTNNLIGSEFYRLRFP